MPPALLVAAPVQRSKGSLMPFDLNNYAVASGAAPPAYAGASPQVQQLYQHYASLPLNQLQQLAVMAPPTTTQGQMIQRAIKAKRLAPATNDAFPSTASIARAAGSSGAIGAMASGGTARHFDGGGSTGGEATTAIDAPSLTGHASGSGWRWNLPPHAANGPTDGSAMGTKPWTAGMMQAPGYGGGAFPSSGAGWSGFPSTSPTMIGAASGAGGTASGGPTGYVRGAYGATLPTMSFSAGNPGELGASWSPGQTLLTPQATISATPPGFGGTPGNAPLVTLPPASVLAAGNPAPAPASMPVAGMTAGGAWRRGGATPRRQLGGYGPSPEAMASFTARRGMGELYHPGGFIDSAVAGRTDHLPLAVPADSHVIPADVVSGLGQGNSLNGAHLLDTLFHSGPWGLKATKSRAPAPHRAGPQALPRLAAGGCDRTTPILAAGGEYLVRPEAVEHFGAMAKHRQPERFAGKTAMQAGHDSVDDFIVRARKQTVRTMKRLPGPVKS
jgi:hypothetical protein